MASRPSITIEGRVEFARFYSLEFSAQIMAYLEVWAVESLCRDYWQCDEVRPLVWWQLWVVGAAANTLAWWGLGLVLIPRVAQFSSLRPI